jgi:hypothetical protein
MTNFEINQYLCKLYTYLTNKSIVLIISLANKQDRRGAIDDEDHIRNKLQIETLKTKHKIVINSKILTKIYFVNFFLRNSVLHCLRRIIKPMNPFEKDFHG